MKIGDVKTGMDMVKYTREKLAAELQANPGTDITDSQDLTGLDEVIATGDEITANAFLGIDKHMEFSHYTDIVQYMKDGNLWPK